MGGVSFDPVFRPALIALMALALGVLAAAVARRDRAIVGSGRAGMLWLLRLALIGALATILMRPMVTRPVPDRGTMPVFPILVDRTASMATEDCGDATRAEAVERALKEARGALEGELGRDYDVRWYTFSAEAEPAPLDAIIGATAPDGEPTDIASALMLPADAGGEAPAGMLLLSDGRVTDPGGSGGVLEAARYLRARQIPVWTATVGEASKSRDVHVIAGLDQNFLFVRQPGTIQVSIDQSGYDSWPATVRLMREGVEVSARQVSLAAGAVQLSFPVKEPVPGLYQYTVRVDALPGEAEEANNRRAVFVRVTDRRTQVLVVEGKPYWDSKFMLQALRKDRNLEITSIFQVNDRRSVAIRYAAPVPGRDPDPRPAEVRIPRTKEELFAYDAVILGRGIDRIYGPEEMNLLRDYLVERGGNLIFARGQAYEGESVLAELEPLVWGADAVRDVKLGLTSQGRQASLLAGHEGVSPELLMRELPSLLSVTRVHEEKSLAVVLARAGEGAPEDFAVIAWQHFGKGKVMSVGGAGLWRWSLVPNDAARYKGIYEEFWTQLVRWLVAYSDFLPGQEITFEVNRNAFDLGERVRLSIRTRQVNAEEYRPRIEVARGGGETVTLTPDPVEGQPGAYACVFQPDAEGEYTATLRNNVGEPKEETVRFTVYEDKLERRFVAADPGLMAQVARTTGGEALALDQIGELPGRLKAFREATAERPQAADAWDHPMFFLLLACLAGCEWVTRRLSGLV